jgi:hypothetical protein
LRDLRRISTLDPGRETERLQRLRLALRIERGSRLTPADRGVLNMTLVEVERLCGNTAGALRRLAMVRDQLGRDGTSFFLREWWLAVDRLGEVPARASATSDVEIFCEEFEEFPLLCAAFVLERVARMPVSSRRSVRNLLTRAEEFVQKSPDHETQWHARVLEERARLDQDSERQVPAGYRGAAAALYVALGDVVAVTRTSRQPGAERSANFEGNRARVVVFPGGEPSFRTIVPPSAVASPEGRASRLLGELHKLASQPRPDRASVRIQDRWINDQVGPGVELGSLLFPPPALQALRLSPSEVDLHVEVESGRLDFVPWELARTPDRALVALDPQISALSRAISRDAATRDEMRFLQVALNRLDGDLVVDSDFGPASMQGLVRYKSKRGFTPNELVDADVLTALQEDIANRGAKTSTPPLVILVQPSHHRQFEGTRGFASVGVDVDWLYQSSGFEVWRVEDPSVDEIHRALEAALSESRPPAVLHLSGGLRESSRGVALTFLAGEWHSEYLGGSRFSDEFSVTVVDDLLSAVPPEAFRPLLILDNDRPPGITETVSHLFMRNAFAGGVFRMGRCPAVLATGLVDEASTGVYTLLVKTLSSGATVAETASAIRHGIPESDRKGSDVALPFVGTALFTHLPWLRPVVP